MKKITVIMVLLGILFLSNGCLVFNNYRNRTMSGYYRCPTNNQYDYFIKQGTGRKMKIRKLR